MLRPQAAGRLPLVGYYALYFGSVGIILPFLPAYLESLALSVTQVGMLLALGPLMSLVAPPVWGHLADRTGHTSRLLTLVSVGALVGFAPLLFVDHFPTLIATLAGYAFFSSAIVPLVDSIALQHIAQTGGSYAHLRLFGSIGFVLSSTLFGLATHRVDQTTVFAGLGLLTALTLWSLTLHASSRPSTTLHPLSGLRLLGNRDLRWLLAASSLHWLSCAPYHGTFGIHVLALGLSPAVVGISAGLGVAVEVVVMFLYPRVAERVSPRHVLLLAFVSSALRWAGVSMADSSTALVALSMLHGMTFGAFYVASIAYMATRVPPHLRASGQSLYAAATFGIGGLVGYTAAGIGYDWLGGHRLFGVAAGLELLAAACVLRISSEARAPEVQVHPAT